MISIAFPHLRQIGAKSWEIDLDKPFPQGSDNYRCNYLLPMTALLAGDRFRLRSLDDVLVEGCPFVFPIEPISNYINWLSTTENIDDFLEPYIPTSVIRAARAGRAVILFFYATEAQFQSFVNHPSGRDLSVYDVLYDYVRRHRIPRKAFWFFNGNPKGPPEFSAWQERRQGSGSAAPPFEVRFTDLYWYMAQSMYRMLEQGRCLSAQLHWSYGGQPGLHRSSFTFDALDRPIGGIYAEPVSRDAGDFSPSKLFLCMNRNPKPHRRIVVCHLQRLGLLDRSLVSFNDPDPERIEFDDPDLQRAWRELRTKLPLTIDRSATTLWQDFYLNSVWLGLAGEAWPYLDTVLSIVTESDPTKLFISEKSWKPIVNCHPFILIAYPGSLAYIRSLGFKTFSPFIDENYDEIEDEDERVTAIFAQIAAIGALSPDELARLSRNLEPIARYNRQHFLSAQTPIERHFGEIERQLSANSTRKWFEAPLFKRIAARFAQGRVGHSRRDRVSKGGGGAMSDDSKPLKRSEILAIENVRRIAEQLRTERNDAVALAQVRREQLDKAVGLLKEVAGHGGALPPDLGARIAALLADPDLP